VFSIVGPQPFHTGAAPRSRGGGRRPAPRPVEGPGPSRVEGAQLPIVLPDNGARNLRPVSSSAIARRSSPLSASPWYFIEPDVSASMMACGDRPCSASGDGARGSSAL
jgi:hypothetical protein